MPPFATNGCDERGEGSPHPPAPSSRIAAAAKDGTRNFALITFNVRRRRAPRHQTLAEAEMLATDDAIERPCCAGDGGESAGRDRLRDRSPTGSGRLLGVRPRVDSSRRRATLGCGALHQAAKTLSDELIDRGITVNTVNPGPTDTGWEITNQDPRSAMPLGRWGQPDDAAPLIAWLC